ncbi:MAG: hypothetical protein HY911_02140 [Desulfobacterales bacterium]|nr:hypothetical protein [Desulfobacterales bacterium]
MSKRLRWLKCITLAVLALFWAALPVFAGDEDAEGWKKREEQNGVVGYERKVEGSKYLQTKAETTIDAPMDVLLEVLMDIPSFPQWMHKCKESVPLEKKGDYYRVLYFLQGVPLGSPDRDAVIEAKTEVDFNNGSSVTTLESIDNHPYKPEKEDSNRQRMDKFSGKFELKMVDRNRTWVRYTAFTDPGGFAPAMVVKGVIRKVTFNTVQDWARMAKDPAYIKKAEGGIVKPEIEKAISEGSLKFAASGAPTAAQTAQ